METEENRRFQRLKASIPCVVTWESEAVKAQITNLSHGGAFITQASLIPDAGAQVIVTFQAEPEEIRFRAQVREITEADHINSSFGIEFRDTQGEIESNLIRLVDALLAGDPEENPSQD